MSQYLWQVLPPAPPEFLSRASGLHPLLLQLLYNRGMRDPAQGKSFLAADERLCYDPWLLPEMGQAVNRLCRALLSGEKIAVYGDYDTDGITATALLVQGLEAVGANTIPYIPNRLQGHGLHPPALASLFQQGATLVITADCGTTCYQEVAEAQKRGQDIIITDHHTCPPQLPPALATVNPKRPDSTYPYPELAGVGVAYKLLQALYRALGRDHTAGSALDLVALGTVTDVAPLTGENRYLVKEGLRLINRTHRVGLQEMLRCAGLEPGRVDAGSIAWTLGPRLNAAGRLEHAFLSYHLLLTTSSQEGQLLAQELETKNSERQRLLEESLVKAREQALAQGEARLVLVQDRDVPVGVAGLVASRLVDELRRPAVVVRIGRETCRGSGRSVPGFNLVAALQENAELLLRFGGHPMAAGFSITPQNLALLGERLREKAQRALEGLDVRPQLTIDAEVPLSALESPFLASLPNLAPFGFGNPTPVFLSRGVKVLNSRPVGDGGRHLRLKLQAGPVAWPAVAFNRGIDGQLPPALDIVFSLKTDHWGGRETLELNLLDFQPGSPPGQGR